MLNCHTEGLEVDEVVNSERGLQQTIQLDVPFRQADIQRFDLGLPRLNMCDGGLSFQPLAIRLCRSRCCDLCTLGSPLRLFRTFGRCQLLTCRSSLSLLGESRLML